MTRKASHVPLSRPFMRLRHAARPARDSQPRPNSASTSAGDTVTAKRSWAAGLRKRTGAAFVLMPVVVALIWFGGWAAFGGTFVVLILALLELRGMFAERGWHPLLLLCWAVSVDFLVAGVLPAIYWPVLYGLGFSALLFGAFVWLMFTRQTSEQTLVDWALTIAIPLYVGWPLAFMLLLRRFQPGYTSRGFWWLLALFCMVWANDTAAFVVGHFWGRTKLAPRVSPAKTREGFIGGLVWSVIAAFIILRAADLVLPDPLHIAWYNLCAIGILVSLAATAGDLAESFLKRCTHVKDSGALIPGHGGILDRVDSQLFAVILLYFYALFLGKL